jgi:hypothetical protein
VDKTIERSNLVSQVALRGVDGGELGQEMVVTRLESPELALDTGPFS